MGPQLALECEKAQIVDELLDLRNREDNNPRQQEFLHAALWRINRALKRIEEHSFGSCLVCGQPIGDQRLRDLPWAEVCVNCARRNGRNA